MELQKKKKVRMVGLELDKDLMDKVRLISKKEECSQTDVLNTCLDFWIKHYESSKRSAP